MNNKIEILIGEFHSEEFKRVLYLHPYGGIFLGSHEISPHIKDAVKVANELIGNRKCKIMDYSSYYEEEVTSEETVENKNVSKLVGYKAEEINYGGIRRYFVKIVIENLE